MFGMSFAELVIIAILALILLGPDKLPDAARGAGKLMRELRRATDDIKDQLETEIYADELKRRPSPVPPVPVTPPAASPGEAGRRGTDPELPSPYPELRSLSEPSSANGPAPVPPEDPGQAKA